ncbi:MAG TPA: glycine cleavage T C-terminal barrel domain-containing protein, partial [Chloroflexota bacterium]|nr:glycine cleavage T C-terminal barrel domain-containing protein [Chloroflexota bacterium]
DLRPFALAPMEIAGITVLAARTGYTGEDGFELFVPPARAVELWRLLLEHGAAYGLRPVGLGARDTLRLEARLPLYGNDITDQTTPLEAGLSRFVKLDKPRFRGRDVLCRQKEEGPARKLVGLEMADRAVPRAHYPVAAADGSVIGEVTSGSFSPTLARGIALAYVPAAYAAIGTALQITVRGQGHPAVVVKTPFYKRAKQ